MLSERVSLCDGVSKKMNLSGGLGGRKSITIWVRVSMTMTMSV